MSESTPTPRPRRTLRRALLIAAAAIVALAIAAALILPRLLDVERYRPRLEAALEEATGWDVTLGDLGFSVVRGLVVTVEPLALASPDGESRVDVELVEVKAALRPLLSGRLDIRRVELAGPDARLVRASADDPWPLPIPPPAAEGAKASVIEVLVDRIDVRRGRAVLEDRGAATPLRIAVEDLAATVRPQAATFDGSLRLAESDGTVAWSGTSAPALALDATLDDIPTEMLRPWIGDALVGPGGRISGSINVRAVESIDGALTGRSMRLLAGERPLDDVRIEFRLAPEGEDGWTAERIEMRTGSVVIHGSGPVLPDVDLRFDIPDTPLGPALESARALFPVPLELEPPGRASAVVEVKRPTGRELEWSARGTLAAATVPLVETLPPARDVESTFRVGRDGVLVVDVTSGTLAGGPVKGTARLAPLLPPGRLVFDGTIGRAGLGTLLAGVVQQADRKIAGPTDVAARIETDLSTGMPDLSALRGRISLDAREVTLPGWDLEAAIQARLDETRGKLGKLADLAGRVDPELAQKIAGQAGSAANGGDDAAQRAIRSVFETLAVTVSLDGSPWALERLEAATRSVAATGGGRFDPGSGTVDVGLTVRVSPERTQALIQRYPDLKLLLAKDGRLSLPMNLSGPMTKPGIKVDFAGIAAGKAGVDSPTQIREQVKQEAEARAREEVEERVKEKARGLFDRLLDKKKKPGEGAAPPPAPGGESGEPPADPEAGAEPGGEPEPPGAGSPGTAP